MNTISYAQNFEDIMLWRALKHIDKGFYIDAGAWSPDIDSVTKLFYKKGWKGINIEPNPKFHTQLEKKRPNDINLCVAVSNKSGSLEMNFIGETGMSTLVDDIAIKHNSSGFGSNKKIVQITTLENICNKHISQKHDIHFLKIDVEGLEEAVLQGHEWVLYRPWIIVIEATFPMSQKETHKEWESILLSANYQLAYMDGLNRFYISKEHLELLPSFKYPPNVFDEFLTYPHMKAEEQVFHQHNELEKNKIEIHEINQTSHHWWLEAERLNKELEESKIKTEEFNQSSHHWWLEAEKLNKELEEGKIKTEEFNQSSHHWWLEAEKLNKVLEEGKIKTEEFNQSSHHWWLEAERLNKELEESKVKNEELNQSSHHWWLEAERLDKEIQSPIKLIKNILNKLLPK